MQKVYGPGRREVLMSHHVCFKSYLGLPHVSLRITGNFSVEEGVGKHCE